MKNSDQDGAEPSINSVASMNLIRLYGITNEKTYNERAQKIFESAAESLEKYPFALTKMVSALQKHVRPIKQVPTQVQILSSSYRFCFVCFPQLPFTKNSCFHVKKTYRDCYRLLWLVQETMKQRNRC